jgi:N-methylhydantoinase A
MLVHGTTLATNALLTGNIAKVGMLTTKGFRDVIHIRRGFKNIRTSMFNVFIPPYHPLVPRRLRLAVEERTLHTGEIRAPLNEAETRAAVEQLAAEGVEAVAVCFLHSYARTRAGPRPSAASGSAAPTSPRRTRFFPSGASMSGSAPPWSAQPSGRSLQSI